MICMTAHLCNIQAGFMRCSQKPLFVKDNGEMFPALKQAHHEYIWESRGTCMHIAYKFFGQKWKDKIFCTGCRTLTSMQYQICNSKISVCCSRL